MGRNNIFYNTNFREVDHYECRDKLNWEVQWQNKTRNALLFKFLFLKVVFK
jgi:hypothetical protein